MEAGGQRRSCDDQALGLGRGNLGAGDCLRGDTSDHADDGEGDAEVMQQAPIAAEFLLIAQFGQTTLIALPAQ